MACRTHRVRVDHLNVPALRRISNWRLPAHELARGRRTPPLGFEPRSQAPQACSLSKLTYEGALRATWSMPKVSHSDRLSSLRRPPVLAARFSGAGMAVRRGLEGGRSG